MRLNATVNMAGLMLKFKYIRQGAQQGLSNTVFEGAVIFQQEAKATCAVDTGFMRDHIDVEMVTETATRAEARVISRAPYSIFVEYGTRFQTAQPFMRPALDNKRGEVLGYIESSVKSAVAQEVEFARG